MTAPHYLLACVLGAMLFGLLGLRASEGGRENWMDDPPEPWPPQVRRDAWKLFVFNGYPAVLVAGAIFGAFQVWGPLTRPFTTSRAVAWGMGSGVSAGLLVAMLLAEKGSHRLFITPGPQQPTWHRLMEGNICWVFFFVILGGGLGCFVRALDWAQEGDESLEVEGIKSDDPA